MNLAALVDIARALVAPGLGVCISGVILAEETMGQARAEGTRFVQLAHDAGLLVGVKVDGERLPSAALKGAYSSAMEAL